MQPTSTDALLTNDHHATPAAYQHHSTAAVTSHSALPQPSYHADVPSCDDHNNARNRIAGRRIHRNADDHDDADGDDDDCDDDGPHGVRGWFYRALPDRESRLAFGIAFLAALTIAIYWSYYTIHNKWLYSYSHPESRVTVDSASSLPGLASGMALSTTYPLGVVAGEWSWVIWAESLYADHVVSVDGLIACKLAVAYGYVCQPIDAQGKPMYQPSQQGMVGNEADGTGEWRLRYTSRLQALCYTNLAYVNRTLLNMTMQQSIVMTSMAAIPLTATDMRVINGEQNSSSIPIRPSSNSTTPIQRVSGPLMFPYDSLHTITFRPHRRETLDHVITYQYDYNLAGGFSLNDVAKDMLWWELYNRSSIGTRWFLRKARYEWDEDLELKVTRICTVPATFDVQVSTEVTTYGFESFLSDVGGFLNLLSLFFVLLFPLTYKVTQPRSFVAMYIAYKCRRVQRRKKRTRSRTGSSDDESHHASVEQWKSKRNRNGGNEATASAAGDGTQLMDVQLIP